MQRCARTFLCEPQFIDSIVAKRRLVSGGILRNVLPCRMRGSGRLYCKT